jgi:hypothetical protein
LPIESSGAFMLRNSTRMDRFPDTRCTLVRALGGKLSIIQIEKTSNQINECVLGNVAAAPQRGEGLGRLTAFLLCFGPASTYFAIQ